MPESAKGQSVLSQTTQRLQNIFNHLSSMASANVPDKRHKVLVSRNLGQEAMALIEGCPKIDLVLWPHDRPCEKQWLLENVGGCSGIAVTLSEKINEELLDKAGPALKVVSTMSVGYEHVSLPELAKRGIKLGYTPNVLNDAVADVAVMLALMAGRHAKLTMSVVDQGEWPNSTWSPFSFCGPQLSVISNDPSGGPPNAKQNTRTVGFLGFGRIAQATLRRLIPFGITHFIFTTRSTAVSEDADKALAAQFQLAPERLRHVDIDTLARESDVLIVLAPGGDSTYHIINEGLLRKMKKTTILVNPSRGTLVDSEALAKALKEGWIAAAGLDVVEGEPNVTAEHPLVKEPKCIILPHIGSATYDTRLGMARLAAKNLVAGVLGEPLPAEFK